MKLGKKPKRDDWRNLKAKKYFKTLKETGALPPLPDTVGHGNLIAPTAWQMFCNDVLGCCVVADTYHFLKLIFAEFGKTFNVTDANIVTTYTAATGYNPADPSTDQGTDMLTMMKLWKNTGIVDADGNYHKIFAFLEIETIEELYYAIHLFGAAHVGVMFPDSAMTQFENGKAWNVIPNDAPATDGHCILGVMAYPTSNAPMDFITWGADQKAMVAWIEKQMDEAYLVLTQEAFNNQQNIDKFDWDAVVDDLDLVGTLPPSLPVPASSESFWTHIRNFFNAL